MHDFTLTGPVLAASDLITTQPSFVMYEVWKLYDLQVLEPVAAPRDFPVRLAWSARYATDPANARFRETVLASYMSHEADVAAQMAAAAIPLGA